MKKGPYYFNRGKIEVIEFIEDQGFDKDFYKAAAIGCICRAGFKNGHSEISDLKKAIWYLRKKIKRLKKIK